MARVTIFLTGILLIFSQCRNSDNVPLRAVHIAGVIPAITADTSYTISNSYDIFYYKNLIMYKFQYGFDSLFNGRPVLHESRPNFFVFHKDSLFGYSFFPHPDRGTKDEIVSVDSVFSKNAYSPFKFDSLLTNKPDSSFFNSQNDLVEVYNYPKTGSAEDFTYYLYFSKKFKGLTDGFFSRSMADKDGMKLFRIRIVAHGHYYDEYKLTLPKRELLYEMTEAPIKDTAEIMMYFDRYVKEVLKS